VELDEVDVVCPETLERQTDLVARLGIGALARLRRDEETLAARALEPRRDTQLGVAVARCGVDVVHTTAFQHLEHTVRHVLRHA
jgi:hypothetical protein